MTTEPPSAASVDRAKLFASAKTVVVKIGSGVLKAPRGIDRAVLASLAREVAALGAPPRRVLVVSSGAIALGVEQLGMDERPRRMDGLQAAAAAGQGHLIRLWGEALAAHGRVVAQVLLTHADLADRKRYLNARRAFAELLRRAAVPVINENDTVSVEEIAFGDNDALSAQVANLVHADLLVMLSVAPGLLAGETRVPVVAPGDRSVDRYVRTDLSGVGTGGMVTKVRAARAATAAGCAAVIAPGKQPGVLDALFRGDDVGTLFLPEAALLSSRAHWIAHTLRPRGVLVVDDGAREAVVTHQRSLLPSGVVEVRGTFREGDPVDLATAGARPFARGLATYSSEDLRKLCGKKTREILEVLGYHLGDEAVHRDDLVVL